jgi:hypothetical protein
MEATTDFVKPAMNAPASNPPPAPQPAASPTAPPPTSAPTSTPPVGGAPPPAPPPKNAPPPRHDAPAASGAGYEVETHEALERAIKMKRSNRGVWILPLVLVLIAALILGGYGITKLTTHNPPLVSVEKSVQPVRSALNDMSPQTGVGYTFHLPESFVAGEAPATGSLPDGTASYSWQAPKDSEDEGCELRIWVIPKEMNLREQLAGLSNVNSWVAYSADVSDKTLYRRLGDDMLCVYAHVDGSTKQTTRKGVIYLIIDDDRTIMAIGMGVGGNWKQVRYLLNNSIRSIQRADP